jgi:hypothetical protein
MLRRGSVLGLSISLFVVTPAKAQVAGGLIVQSQIPQDYYRGRNVSVSEQQRPEYMPLGVRLAGVLLYPSVDLGGGGTTNAYLRGDGVVKAAFASVTPSVRLVSAWSRHELQVTGSTTLRDYFGEERRNERLWDVGAAGRLDVLRVLKVDAAVNTSSSFENLFSGEVTPTVAALSRYRRNFGSLRATYTSGRGRAFLLTDYTDLRFRPVALLSGGARDQGERNRHVVRLAGQLEYARSPTISLFGQLSGNQTRYDRDPALGRARVDSNAARFLVGVNADIAGRMRGTVGLGYSIRDYTADAYKTVRGLSVETSIQLFPLRRLTVSIDGERSIGDASINLIPTPFWNTSVSLRAEYELLRNVILTASAENARQRYLRNPLRGEIQSAKVAGRFLVSRRIALRSSLSFTRRSSNDAALLNGASEGRIEAGITYRL